jgi:hypothetical protein
MDFWIQNSWSIPLIAIFLWTMIWSIDWWVCVKDLKWVRYHNKETKGKKIKCMHQLGNFGLLNGLIRNIFLYHIRGRGVLWYFVYMLKERETLDETLMTWK